MSFNTQELSDIECIRNVGRRYSHSLDRLDKDGMRSVYWPDSHDDHGPEFRGNSWDYVDVAMESHRRWRPSMHCLMNHLVELDPGGVTARGEIYCVAYLFEADRPALHMWLGRYLDRYEKTRRRMADLRPGVCPRRLSGGRSPRHHAVSGGAVPTGIL